MSEKRETANGSLLLGVVTASVWGWALALLATRQVQILDCSMLAPAPPAWGFLSLSGAELVLVGLAAAAIGWSFNAGARIRPEHRKRVAAWLLLVGVIPGLDVLRFLGFDWPVLFWESLWFVWATGFGVAQLCRGLPSRMEDSELPFSELPLSRLWPAVTCLATLLAAMWWYLQAAAALDQFQLGFQDFGQFARRVVNTWEGRGFLSKTPSLPPFWDHFNPGLALLSPLWGMWPSPKLFLVVQAVCLALPAVFVYGIARRFRATQMAACFWGITFLLQPAVGQMNLNYTYGWHPVSLAMPLMFAAILALTARRHILAAACTLIACSFNEAVFVSLGCFAAAMTITAWLSEKQSESVDAEAASIRSVRYARPIASAMPWKAWLTTWATITVGFLLVWKFAGFNEFQDTRVASELGWQNAVKVESIWFLAGLLIPVGLHLVFRAWTISLALAPPIGVLLMWSYEHSTSLAFQYTSTLAPVLLAAAVAGSQEIRKIGKDEKSGESLHSSPALATGVLVAAFFATLFFGAMPWSRPTLELTRRLIYPSEQFLVNPERSPGSEGLQSLRDAVRHANEPKAAVLATGYIAPHLLGVRRLEPVNEAPTERREALAREAGEGRDWIELFDWVVLDTYENFQQGGDLTRSVMEEARAAGFRVVSSQHGVVLLRRGSTD